MIKKSALSSITFSLILFLGFSFSKAYAADVVYSLDPASETVNQGETLTVKVMLDSQTQEINGGDLYILYDSSKVEINQTDITKGAQGYNYGEGTCDLRLKGAFVDSEKVRFGYSCEDDQGLTHSFKGLVNVGNISLKALLGSGSTDLEIKYIPGGTVGDSNAGLSGVDYLTGVSGGTYTLAAGESETHKECNASNICVDITGAGTDACTTNADCSSQDEPVDTYLDCVNNMCVSKEGSQSDHASCAGRYAGASCTTSSGQTTTTTTTTSSSNGSTSSAVPQTAGNIWLTVFGGLASVGLIVLSVLVL